MRTRKSLAAILTAGMCLSIHAQAQSPTADTASGDVVGAGTDIHVFEGVPYAAPPVGPLRWRPPEPVVPWTGVRGATQFGADCMQKPLADSRAPGVSEDCLTLNIWVPAQIAHELLPVMVWVYGGGFVNGSASKPLYDGEALARKGVVLVSLNTGRQKVWRNKARVAADDRPYGLYRPRRAAYVTDLSPTPSTPP